MLYKVTSKYDETGYRKVPDNSLLHLLPPKDWEYAMAEELASDWFYEDPSNRAKEDSVRVDLYKDDKEFIATLYVGIELEPVFTATSKVTLSEKGEVNEDY